MSDAPELKFTSLEEIVDVRMPRPTTPNADKRGQLTYRHFGFPQIHATLRKSFRAGKLRSIDARKAQILQLAYLLQDNYDRFKETFASDLGRPSLETAL